MFSDLRAIDVFAAARRIRDHVRHTTLRRSTALSELARGDVYLKLETEQETGSFKIRGAFNVIADLPPGIKARGVVASSAGNHGMGVAHAARHYGVPATIFVPTHAPEVKRHGIAALGATVNTSQPDYDSAMVAAKAYAHEHGSIYINPCLGAALLAGQGTVALEIVTDLPDVAAIVLPVGGGGLTGGVGSFMRTVAPFTRIIGAQSDQTAAMSRSLAAGRVVDIPSVPTLADGLAGAIDDDALDIGRHALDAIVTVTEEEIARAIAWMFEREALTVEGAGVAAAAAIIHGRIDRLPTPAVVIVSGGNIDPARHQEILARYGSRGDVSSLPS